MPVPKAVLTLSHQRKAIHSVCVCPRAHTLLCMYKRNVSIDPPLPTNKKRDFFQAERSISSHTRKNFSFSFCKFALMLIEKPTSFSVTLGSQEIVSISGKKTLLLAENVWSPLSLGRNAPSTHTHTHTHTHSQDSSEPMETHGRKNTVCVCFHASLPPLLHTHVHVHTLTLRQKHAPCPLRVHQLKINSFFLILSSQNSVSKQKTIFSSEKAFSRALHL